MGAKINSSTDKFQVLPASGLRWNNTGGDCVCVWVKPNSLGASGKYHAIFSAHQGLTNHYEGIYFKSDGTNLKLLVGADNGAYTEQLGATNVTVGTWNHVCLYRNGSGLLFGYLNGIVNINAFSSAADASQFSALEFGNITPFASTDWGDVSLFGAKFFRGGTIDAEFVRKEMRTIYPATLGSWSTVMNVWPVFRNGRTRVFNHAGNTGVGVDLTEVGAITDDGNPGGVSFWNNNMFLTVAAASLEQEGYRWRNDDGSETTASWSATQDTPGTVVVNTTTRLRQILNATNSPNPGIITIEYRKTGSLDWRKLE